MSSRSRWLSAIGVVLVTGFVLTSIVAASDDTKSNPFKQILQKLDQILTKLNSGSGERNHTLRWDTNNPSASRFVVLAAFNNAAVLDKNTGLVWEQAPDGTDARTWAVATSYCANKTVGGTVGWRLPSVIELKSIQDPTLPAPYVPATVFTGVPSRFHWSASASVDSPGLAWIVGFSDGIVGRDGKAGSQFVWCVRGPMQESAY